MEKNKDLKTDTKTSVSETAFSKEQLIHSRRFRCHRDALSACLDDGKKYTIAEAQKALALFMKGR